MQSSFPPLAAHRLPRGATPALETYWAMPPDDLLAALGSGPAGLSDAEAAARLARYGPNQLHARQRAGALRTFLRQFTSPIILILLFATTVSAVLGDWIDAAIILAIILGSATLSFAQEYRADAAAEKLRAQVQMTATVVRDGQPRSIPMTEVVPGDIALLSAGSRVPADGVLLEAKDLFANQAVLTGEAFPVEKHTTPSPPGATLAARGNCVFFGTSISSGSGRMLVVQTGAATALGGIAARLQTRPPETDFERGIRRLGALLSEVTLLLVLAVFAVNVFFRQPVIDSLLFSLALAVGLTPQLLPAIININLSRGAQAMARAGVIVRRLAAIENFGAMNVLCTDKTGTLTLGVVRLDGALDPDGHPSDAVRRAAWLNARLQSGLPNPLDEAICAASPPPGTDGVVKVDEVPYDFSRKRLSVVVRDGARLELLIKGAFEQVLAVCTTVARAGGSAPLDDALRAALRQRFAAWSAQGYRVLGVAAADVTHHGEPPAHGYTRDDERDLTFLGFLLFLDPPKPGVAAVIGDLRQLGVALKIITGDNRLVAQHVAQQLGLDASRVVTGGELTALPSEALPRVAGEASLFAKVDPNQKEQIIRALRQSGAVVGYMGDGINDAPALHSADVSISVDTAVDVAKDAADFVLLQKDLAVLHQGIIAGRTTFANTLKYVFMAVSANFGNMFSVAGAALFLPFLPMLPKQILLINVLTDLPEMTIAGDNVDSEQIARPERWDIGGIRDFMLVFGLLSSVFDYLTFGVLWWWLRAGPALFHTGWFVESVWSATLVVYAIRTRLPLWRSQPSRLMLLVTGAVLLVVLALPYSPLAGLLGFTPLPAWLLLLLGGIVALYVAAAEAMKRWFYARPGR